MTPTDARPALVSTPSPSPGRIRREFAVNLPRARDFNDVAIAQHAGEIMASLKTILAESAA